MFRLSFRSGKDKKPSEPVLDFRPTSARKNSASNPEDVASFEQLSQHEIKRWSQGGGGAVVGDVEWVPDPVTGGQRAVFRPVSTKILQKAVEAEMQSTDYVDDDAFNMSQATEAHVMADGTQTEVGVVGTLESAAEESQKPELRVAPPRKPREMKPAEAISVQDMTPAQRSEHAKRVIEAAIEAERLALEKKLAIKKNG